MSVVATTSKVSYLLFLGKGNQQSQERNPIVFKINTYIFRFLNIIIHSF